MEPLRKRSALMNHLIVNLIKPDPTQRLDIVQVSRAVGGGGGRCVIDNTRAAQVSQAIAPLLVDELSHLSWRYQRLNRGLAKEKKDKDRCA